MTTGPGASPPRSTAERVLDVVGLGLIAYAVVLMLDRLRTVPFLYNVFSDRDLVRAARLWEDLPTAGAELSAAVGGRVPGGFQYVVFAAAQAIHDHPTSVQRLAYALDAVAFGLLAWTASRAVGGGTRGRLAAGTTMVLGLGTVLAYQGLLVLWNPSFLPFFVAASVVLLYDAVTRRDGRRLPLWGVALGLGAQFHLSILLWTVASLVVLLAARVPNARRWVPLTLLAFVATYTPHLIDEALHGWPNTRMLMQQPHISPTGRAAMTVASLRDQLGFLTAHDGPPGRLAWLPLAAFLVGLLRADHRTRRGDAGGNGLLAVGAATLLGFGLMAMQPSTTHTARYFLVFLPGLAVVAGAGLADAVAALVHRSTAAGTVLVLALLPPLVSPTLTWFHAADGEGRGWHDLESILYGTRAHTGWTWEELAGRLVIAQKVGPTIAWEATMGVDDVLRREGAAFTGSRPPPCALALRHLEAEPLLVDDALLARTVAVGTAVPRLIEEVSLDRTARLAIYDPGTPLCPTSLIDRYLDTEVEKVARAAQPEPGQVVTLPSPAPGVSRHVATFAGVGDNGDPMRLVLLLDLESGPAGTVATLHSNQLRGEALNLGWYVSALVDRPRLRFEPLDGGEPVEAVLYDGWLGFRAAVTPVRAPIEPPPGPSRVVLVIDLARGVGTKLPWPTTELVFDRHEVLLVPSWSPVATAAQAPGAN